MTLNAYSHKVKGPSSFTLTVSGSIGRHIFSGGTIWYFDSLYPGELSDEVQCWLRARCLFLMQLEKKALMLSCAYLTFAGYFLFARLTAYAMTNGPQSIPFPAAAAPTLGFFVRCPYIDVLHCTCKKRKYPE